MLLASGALTVRLAEEPETVSPLALVNVTVELWPDRVAPVNWTVMAVGAIPTEELAVNVNAVDGWNWYKPLGATPLITGAA
jgi:hypothetical protein